MSLLRPALALAACLVFSCRLNAQVPPGSSVGLTPLNDLGSGLYLGQHMGGLYPGGSNVLPTAHAAAGAAATASILRRDAGGQPDPQNGKIVLVSIGMSNATLEFSEFVSESGQDPQRAAGVRVVDCAQGGVDAVDMSDPLHPFWQTTVPFRLQNAQVTAAQVQAVWLKEAIRAGSNLLSGDAAADAAILSSKLTIILQILHQQFPNLSVVYLSSRIYAGYTPGSAGEPLAYGSGFAVKWTIEAQIGGDPALNFDPAQGPVLAPWIAWGPYLWADGLNPRSDGLVWEAADLAADGVHPSLQGRIKVASFLTQFFHDDPLASSWYLGTPGALPAGVFAYGTATPGGAGDPILVSNGLPWLGNPNFALGVQSGAPSSWAILMVSLAPGYLPLGTGVIWLDAQGLIAPAPGLPNIVTLNGAGSGFLATSIPMVAALDGFSLYAQWLIQDPQGQIPFLGGLSLSRGAQVRLGAP